MLRSLRLADLPAFAAYRADPQVAEFQGWTPMDAVQARRFLAETAGATRLLPGQWVQLGIALAATDELVGDVGLHLAADATVVELGFTLARAHQRQGHGLRAVGLAAGAAFEHACVVQLRARTDARHPAAITLLGRAGFAPAGSIDTVFKGRPCTELAFVRPRPPLSAARPAAPGRSR
ncbi:GNAT family N-acetyltransferase [Piscinibacter sakaiensis]|uniref:GNAT family N-acetyltransferase n=1 Tax=Piscinibacter sakaiensis TaxID=1547922 RepID=UPI003728D574